MKDEEGIMPIIKNVFKWLLLHGGGSMEFGDLNQGGGTESAVESRRKRQKKWMKCQLKTKETP